MKKEVAEILLKAKAITLNMAQPYRFVSGILSPIYCDNRLLMSYPEERKQIANFFAEKIKDLDFDIVAGTATAGIPWAAWIAAKLEKPMIYIRGETKDHGKQNQIEGELEKGQKVLVIEDLISTGGSSVAAVEAVRQAGGIVENCVAIFTYEMQKANQKFADAKCNLLTLSDFSTLINIAVAKGYLKKEEQKKVLEWNKDSANWGKKMGFE